MGQRGAISWLRLTAVAVQEVKERTVEESEEVKMMKVQSFLCIRLFGCQCTTAIPEISLALNNKEVKHLLVHMFKMTEREEGLAINRLEDCLRGRM